VSPIQQRKVPVFILSIVLTISLNLVPARPRSSATEPHVTCGIKTVGDRFIASPGQEFTCDGDTHRIPQSRWIELIADSSSVTYQAADRELPLEVWPLDQFGFRTVQIPEVQQ
jgi:hypothetical protein